MRAGHYFESPYLNSKDLNGRAVELTVKTVVEGELKEQDGSKAMKLLMHFRNAAKPLILGKLNGQFLIEKLGDETDDWIGATVTIAAVPMQVNGKMIDSLRIISAAKKPAQQS